MIKIPIHAHGIVGIRVEFNHSELIVMKALVERLNSTADVHKPVPQDTRELLEDIEQFFINILPENIMSVEGAYKELFGKPEGVEHRANNEL